MPSALAEAANFIADFGELVAIAPAALALGLCCACAGRRELASAWLRALALALGAAFFAKVEGWPMSGHAAIAVAFQGGLGVLLWRGFAGRGIAAQAAAFLLWGLAAAICGAVWLLAWHPAAEVACGALVGAFVPARLTLVPRGAVAPALGARAMVIVATLVLLLHGVRLAEKPPIRLTWNGIVIV